MNRVLFGMAALVVLWVVVQSTGAAETEKYTLRYKFNPNETLRWDVEHRSMVRATVARVTETTDMVSTSVNTWRVGEVQPDGTATFEHRVEWIDMRHKLPGRSEVHYDSRSNVKPPAGFEDAAKSVGVPLSIIKMDIHGKVLSRKDRVKKPQTAKGAADPASQNEGWITIPLPDGAVAVGHAWSLPQDIEIPLPNGGVKKIKAVQQFKLEDVKTGVAVIRVSTAILTPITDPAVESQLIQREATGTIQFDIEAGRIIGQQLEVDKNVVGFRGDASSIHYVNRFSQRLASEPVKK